MSQNIEIEFKNLLTKTEYEQLLHFFKVKGADIFSQENHYFDTPDFSLRSRGSALRIRQKGDQYEMTLKQPASEGLLESNQILSQAEASVAFAEGILPEGLVCKLITKMEISFSNLTYFGSLTTKRVEFEFLNGLLVLDNSSYLNKQDYEVEYEVTDFESGQAIFRHFLKQHGIPERSTKNKIQRFFDEKSKHR